MARITFQYYPQRRSVFVITYTGDDQRIYQIMFWYYRLDLAICFLLDLIKAGY